MPFNLPISAAWNPGPLYGWLEPRPRLFFLLSVCILTSSMTAVFDGHPLLLSLPITCSIILGAAIQSTSPTRQLLCITGFVCTQILAFIYCFGTVGHPSLKLGEKLIGKKLSWTCRVSQKIENKTNRANVYLLQASCADSALDIQAAFRPKRNLPIAEGDKIKMQAELSNLSDNWRPWLWKRDLSIFHNRGIDLELTVRGYVEIEKAPDDKNFSQLLKAVERWSAQTRRFILESYTRQIGSQSAAFICSMLLGERAVKAPPTVSSDFRTLGLSHLLAASGFNLTILVSIVSLLCRQILRQRLLSFMVLTCCIGTFVVLAGASASVCRAAVMSTICLCGILFRRNIYLPSVLTASLLLFITLNPPCLLEIGLQLSYVATAGILFIAVPMTAYVGENRPKFLKVVTSIFFVITWAQLSVLPLQVLYFWQAGWLFLPANIILTPVIPVLTGLALVAALFFTLCQFLPGLNSICSILSVAIYWLTQLIFATTHGMASLPNALLDVGGPTTLSVQLAYLALITTAIAIHLDQARSQDSNRYPCSIQRKIMQFVFLPLYLVASFCLLFYRPPLAEKTRIISKDAELIIEKDRSAKRSGKELSLQQRRALRYFAARLKQKSLSPEPQSD